MPPSTPTPQTGFPPQMGMPTNINASTLLGKRKERSSIGGVGAGPGAGQGSPGTNMRNKRQNTDGGAGQAQQAQGLGQPQGMNLGGMMPGGQQGMNQAGLQAMQLPQGMNGNVQQQQQQLPSGMALPQSIPMPPNCPFDPRLLPYIQALSNPSTADVMRQNQPAFFASLVKAHELLRSGAVDPETIASMQKYVQQVAVLARVQQQQQAQQQQHQQQPQLPQQQLQQQQQQQPQMQPPASTPASSGPNGATGRKGQADGKPAKSPANPPKKDEKKRSHKAKPKKNAANDLKQREAVAVPAAAEQSNNAAAGPSVLPGPVNPVHPINVAPPPPPAPSIPIKPPSPAYEPVPIESWQKYRHPTLPIMHLQRIPDELDEMKDPTLGGAIQPLSDRTKNQMRTWIDRDIDYASAWDVQRKQMSERMQEWRATQQPAWWEHDKRMPKARPATGLDLIWPVDKNNQRDKKRMNGKHMALRL
jgi:hypothetical protein